MFKYLIFLILISCMPQGGNITVEPGSEGAIGPGPEITTISVMGSQLIIDGRNFTGITHGTLMDPNTGTAKPFAVKIANLTHLISESIDTLSVPVNKGLELILANAYGQTTYPVTFTLQPNAVATANIQPNAVTAPKIPDAGIPVSKLNPSPHIPNHGDVLAWDSSGHFMFIPFSGGGGPTGGITTITRGDGIASPGSSITAPGGTIDVDLGETGDVTDFKIPYFNHQNKIVLDSTSSITGLIFKDGATIFDIYNDTGFLDIVNDVGTRLFSLDYSGNLKLAGNSVCTQATGCSGIPGSTVNKVTAAAPLGFTGTTDVIINAGAVNTANNLVKLDGTGAIPASIKGIVNSVTAGTATYVTPASTGAITVGVVFGPGNAQRHQTYLDNLGTLNPNLNYVIIGNGTSYEVQGGDTLLTSIGAQKADGDLSSLAGLTPYLAPNANMIVGSPIGWITQTVPNCASGNVVIGNGSFLSCSPNTWNFSGGTLTSNNQVGLQIRAEASPGTPTGELRFFGSNNTNYVGLKAASATASNTIWTLPLSDGTAGLVLSTNGAGKLSWIDLGAGNNVTNATPTTDNAIARFDGATGKLIQNSGVIIDDSNNVTGTNAFTSMGDMIVDTNTFFVDSANDRVGIGKTNPSYKLDITGAANSGIHLKQGADSTATLGAFFNGLVLEKNGGTNAYALGYGSSDLFSIDNFNGAIYTNLFTLNASGNGQIKGSLKVGAYTLPSTDGTIAQALTTNGSGVLSWTKVGGINDVSNAGSSTTGNLAAFSDISGKVIADSGIPSINLVTMTASATVGNILTSTGGKGAADSLINISNVPTMAAAAPSSNTVVLSQGPDKKLKTSPYTFPSTLCPANQILKTDASFNFQCVPDTSGVITFNGRSGAVVPVTGDYTASMIPITASGTISATSTQGALNELDVEKLALAGGTMTGTIITTKQNSLEIGPYGAVAGNTSEIRFRELTGSEYVGFKAPDAIGLNVIWTLPSVTGSNGQILTTSSSGVLSWTSPGTGGIGDVVGPATATTDNAMARFDGTSGKLIQNSGIIIDDSNNSTGTNAFTSSGNMTVDTNTFFVDATNNKVGIGTTTPLDFLNIYHSQNAFGGLTIGNPGTGATAQSTINLMTLVGSPASIFNASNKGWQITARSNNYSTVGEPNDLLFAFNDLGSLKTILHIDSAAGNMSLMGQLTINNNGTNSSTFPTTRGTNGYALTTDGAGALSWSSVGGANDVAILATPTVDNAIARFEGTTGKVIQNSGVIIADTTNDITGPQNLTVSGTAIPTLRADGNTDNQQAGTLYLSQGNAFGFKLFYDATTAFDGLKFVERRSSAETTPMGIMQGGKVLIGGTGTTNVGAARLDLQGPNGSGSGPHQTFNTDSDIYPQRQFLNWGHDSVWDCFDCYHDGTNWKNSTASSAFRWQKDGSNLILAGQPNPTAGGTEGLNSFFWINESGPAYFSRIDDNSGSPPYNDIGGTLTLIGPRGTQAQWRGMNSPINNNDAASEMWNQNGGWGWQRAWIVDTNSPPSVFFNGNISAADVVNRSSRILKKNITPLMLDPTLLEKFKQIEVVKYQFRDKPYEGRREGEPLTDLEKETKWHFGIVAEQVSPLFPDLFAENGTQTIMDYENGVAKQKQVPVKGYQATDLLSMVVKVVQEQQKTLDNLLSRSTSGLANNTKAKKLINIPPLEKIEQMEKRIRALEGKSIGQPIGTDPFYNQDRLYIFRPVETKDLISENEKLKRENAALREKNQRIQKQLNAFNARLVQIKEH